MDSTSELAMISVPTMNYKSSGQDDDELPGAQQLLQPDGTRPLLTGIAYPGQNDVKFGRGGDTNYHIGNSRYRYFCNQYKQRYQVASREGRQEVVQEIVRAWRSQDPPGRFVTRTDPAVREKSCWHDVGDEMAIRKTIKVLGEGLGVKRRKHPAEESKRPSPKRRRQDSDAASYMASLRTDGLALHVRSGSESSGGGQAASPVPSFIPSLFGPSQSRDDSENRTAAVAAAAPEGGRSNDNILSSLMAQESLDFQRATQRSSEQQQPAMGLPQLVVPSNNQDTSRDSAPGGIPTDDDSLLPGPFSSNLRPSQQGLLVPVAASLTGVFSASGSSNDSAED